MGEVLETRAVQRRPKEERWDVGAVQAILATPWCNPAPEDGGQVPMVLPPRDGGPVRPPAPVGPNPREGPKQVYIRDADLERYGHTVGCRRCALMRAGQPARGVRHSLACRARIEAAMGDAGDERLQQAHQRQNEEIARRLEASEAARAPEPAPVARPRLGDEPGAGHGGADPAHDGAADHPADLPAPQGPAAAIRAEEMHVEADDDADLMGALSVEGVPWLPSRRVAREANGIYEMLLVHGVSCGDAAAKVAELYSPPRVTAELGRLPNMSFVGGPTFDLRRDANGVAWDLRRADHRRRARQQIREEQPFIVIGSPPCTDFCAIQNLNRRRWSPHEVQRRRAEAMALLGFAVEIYWLQLEAGRHFLHEHPATASSWRERLVQALRRDPRVGEVVGDQCRYGLKTAGPHGEWWPAKKPTRFLSS